MQRPVTVVIGDYRLEVSATTAVMKGYTLLGARESTLQKLFDLLSRATPMTMGAESKYGAYVRVCFAFETPILLDFLKRCDAAIAVTVGQYTASVSATGAAMDGHAFLMMVEWSGTSCASERLFGLLSAACPERVYVTREDSEEVGHLVYINFDFGGRLQYTVKFQKQDAPIGRTVGNYSLLISRTDVSIDGWTLDSTVLTEHVQGESFPLWGSTADEDRTYKERYRVLVWLYCCYAWPNRHKLVQETASEAAGVLTVTAEFKYHKTTPNRFVLTFVRPLTGALLRLERRLCHAVGFPWDP